MNDVPEENNPRQVDMPLKSINKSLNHSISFLMA